MVKHLRKLILLLVATLSTFSMNTGQLLAEDAPFILGKGTNLAHWLSQTKRTGTERNMFLNEADIKRIKALGFDHIRLPIDEMQMWHSDGSRDVSAFETMGNAVKWSLEHNLKVLVDLHILRSHHFNASEKPLWTEKAEQDKFIDLWRDLSSVLAQYPTDMVAYELMNEPVADKSDDWNKLVARAVEALRNLEPKRWLVIGSNRWQSADTFDQLSLPDDKRIILSFHFYEPFLLSHYRTSWTDLRDYVGPVTYPGVILTQEAFDALPPAQQEMVKGWVGKKFNREILLKMMAKPIQKARETGLPLYCGEFGIFNSVSDPVRVQWYKDIIAIFNDHDISYANWNYKSDQFGFVKNDGQLNSDLSSAVLNK